MRLEGKVAVITGSGRGIGAAIVKSMAAEGALVVVTDVDPSSAQDIAAEIEIAGGSAIACEADVADRVQVERLVAESLRSFGTIDILVNNAGITKSTTQRLKPVLWA
jgi:3-oxoacyl-[acyl-carrier protein] reductase